MFTWPSQVDVIVDSILLFAPKEFLEHSITYLNLNLSEL